MEPLFIYSKPDGHIEVLDINEAHTLPKITWTHLATVNPQAYLKVLLQLNPHIVTQLQEAMVNVSE